MICRDLPDFLCTARTIFIPKKEGCTQPSDFRPITISSLLIRCFHKVLANRLLTAVSLDPRQRAFIKADGCAEASFLLDLTLRFHHQSCKSVFIAAVDLSKAFDSVTLESIVGTLRSRGVSPHFITYLQNIYGRSSTTLVGHGWLSQPVHPKRGVRQGDPLSPTLFNILIDGFLKSLPSEIGVNMDGFHLNAIAYADDLLLFASTADGLQELIDRSSAYFKNCGLAISSAKSFVIALRADGKNKKIAVDSKVEIFCDGRKLKALLRTDTFEYLGIPFTPDGRLSVNPVIPARQWFDRLNAAPLKPQQRLWALRNVLLPKLFHRLILGKITIGSLNKLDCLTRTSVRNWLNLPADVPKAFFHAAVNDGGLGISAVRWLIPLLRMRRLRNLMRGDWNTSRSSCGYFERELQLCKRRLCFNGSPINNHTDLKYLWSSKLYASVDGAALRESAATAGQHKWILSGKKFLSGKDFLSCCRLRINALPSLSRTSRGRERDRRCRAGCNNTETTNHILQSCFRTHVDRIKRHDAVVSYISRNLTRSGYQVWSEPHLRTSVGLRKPDILAVMGSSALVIDAQVVSDSVPSNRLHRAKVNYYSRIEDLRREIVAQSGATSVHFHSATLNWRGVWSSESAANLMTIGAINKNDLAVISTRVLIGGLICFRRFNQVTSSVVRYRSGVG